MKKKKAFTLIEIIIVIVILGVLASLALVSFLGAHEPARAGDALNALGLLHGAQTTYCLDHDCSTYPTDCTLLEVSVTPNPDNFDTLICADNGNISVTRTDGSYKITVDKDGAFACEDLAGTKCAIIKTVMPK